MILTMPCYSKPTEYAKEVSSQSIILEIVSRLQPYFRNRWKGLALETKKAKGCYPEFGHLSSFMSDIAAEVNDPVYGNFDSRKEKMLGKPKATSSFSMSVQSADSHKNAKAMPIKESLPSKPSAYMHEQNPLLICVLCEQPHRLWHCDKLVEVEETGVPGRGNRSTQRKPPTYGK